MSLYEYKECLKNLEANNTPDDIKSVILASKFPEIHKAESLNELVDQYQTIKKHMDLMGFQKFILSNNNIENNIINVEAKEETDQATKEEEATKEDSESQTRQGSYAY